MCGMTARHSRIARNEPEEKGEQLSGTVASRAAVPLSSLGRWCAEPDDQTDIFVSILSIPAILSGSSRRCSAVIRPARRALYRDDKDSSPSARNDRGLVMRMAGCVIRNDENDSVRRRDPGADVRFAGALTVEDLGLDRAGAVRDPDQFGDVGEGGGASYHFMSEGKKR